MTSALAASAAVATAAAEGSSPEMSPTAATRRTDPVGVRSAATIVAPTNSANPIDATAAYRAHQAIREAREWIDNGRVAVTFMFSHCEWDSNIRPREWDRMSGGSEDPE